MVPLPVDRISDYAVRPEVLDRIRAGHEAILAEMRPTPAQLAEGLELHYDSYVGDVQGSVQTSFPHGLVGERLRADLRALSEELAAEGLSTEEVSRRVGRSAWARKPPESAFDGQWIGESRALYAVTGVQLATSDVAGPEENSFERALQRLARIKFVYDMREDLIHVAGPADLERGRRENKPAVVFHLAGVSCFAEAEDPLARLDLFHALGVRMSQLTYIQNNHLCSSWLQDEDGGLKDMGRAAVARMNELGMMVDVAHCGDRSALEAVEASAAPPMISHTGCRAVYDDSANTTYLEAVMAQPYARGVKRPQRLNARNASDELLRAIGLAGGLVALYTVGFMLGEGPESFDTWFRHLEHAIEVAGVDAVAVGCDRTFFPTGQPSPLDWTNWPLLTVGMLCRGLGEEDVRKIIGGNYLRHALRVLDQEPWGEFI